MDTITIRRPDDWHVHLREGELMPHMARLTAAQFARATVMPNTLHPPIRTAADALAYRQKIEAATRGMDFTPIMTTKLYPTTTVAMIKGAWETGVRAAKLYPEGVTTHSEDGISLENIFNMYQVFQAMERCGMLLLLHGEAPGHFCLDREVVFLNTPTQLVHDFPRLKIVLEHITTQEAVSAVLSLPYTVAATITLHHLELTLDDVVGDKIKPHNFCKPIAKRPEDRQAILGAALSGSPQFFFGSDSAPHPVGAKECAEGCAGVFTAPVVMPRLVEIFERHRALDRLEDFVAHLGADFYGLPLNGGMLVLVREPWVVPTEYHGVRPYLAGQTLAWQVKKQ